MRGLMGDPMVRKQLEQLSASADPEAITALVTEAQGGGAGAPVPAPER